jgi:C1A family cysteine protease
MSFCKVGGWIRDLPDIRDYTLTSSRTPDKVKQLAEKSGVVYNASQKTPSEISLISWCSPIKDQGELGSCTAHAAASMVEFFELKNKNKYIDASRLFIYKTTRNLMNITGDSGAYIRSTMGALKIFGAPPEMYMPYNVETFDDEPSPFLYSFASNFQAISYYRLDDPSSNNSNSTLLSQIKTSLSAKRPVMFGFSVYSSYTQAETNGGIFPVPTNSDYVVGGHAVLAVGYSDVKKAIQIQNSWGSNWGDSGFGWIPYEYIESGLTSDWWSLLSNEWIDVDSFN